MSQSQALCTSYSTTSTSSTSQSFFDFESKTSSDSQTDGSPPRADYFEPKCGDIAGRVAYFANPMIRGRPKNTATALVEEDLEYDAEHEEATGSPFRNKPGTRAYTKRRISGRRPRLSRRRTSLQSPRLVGLGLFGASDSPSPTISFEPTQPRLNPTLLPGSPSPIILPCRLLNPAIPASFCHIESPSESARSDALPDGAEYASGLGLVYFPSQIMTPPTPFVDIPLSPPTSPLNFARVPLYNETDMRPRAQLSSPSLVGAIMELAGLGLVV